MALFSKSEPCLKPVYPTRRLNCPHCEAPFEAARRAVTLRCPACSKPLQFQDITFDRSSFESVVTLGQVRIKAKARLRGRVDCGSLVVQGGLEGDINVRGGAKIEARGLVSGTLRAHSIAIFPGGRFRGTLDIRGAVPTQDHAEPDES